MVGRVRRGVDKMAAEADGSQPRRKPDRPTIHMTMDHMTMGGADRDLGRKREAMEACRRFIERNPGSIPRPLAERLHRKPVGSLPIGGRPC